MGENSAFNRTLFLIFIKIESYSTSFSFIYHDWIRPMDAPKYRNAWCHTLLWSAVNVGTKKRLIFLLRQKGRIRIDFLLTFSFNSVQYIGSFITEVSYCRAVVHCRGVVLQSLYCLREYHHRRVGITVAWRGVECGRCFESLWDSM